ncbi:hypothetical protein PPERSA_06688 [Pseudocohnilembus persalinus]|uniref:Cation/H+ exchanger transmembrane domain-containing protein n=1 Tax=Pseudocohnilembus persalinus TaxID=266149 RepID=A0A0V0QRU7_PSEPJ|nr:hypothetical protein PPERSA_06688 [Pseudocohnilembus persalinus]|eukprot:KRX05054.1 hypothetical protein PPERSA_06688 [Pseudocohnilembus persalinus]
MGFSEIEGMQNQMEKKKQTKEWLSKIFFSSLGFVIPIKETLTWKSFGGGLLYTIPAVLGKLFTGIFAHKGDGWIVGWAMVGRGELGFVMAKTSLEKDVMGEYTFSISVWALLISTIISPFIFKFCIMQKEKKQKKDKYRNLENIFKKQKLEKQYQSESENEYQESQKIQKCAQLVDYGNLMNRVQKQVSNEINLNYKKSNDHLKQSHDIFVEQDIFQKNEQFNEQIKRNIQAGNFLQNKRKYNIIIDLWEISSPYQNTCRACIFFIVQIINRGQVYE